MAVAKNAFKASLQSGSVANSRALVADRALGELIGRKLVSKEAVSLPLDLLDNHPEQHVFSMLEDELQYLTQSIIEVGVLEPITVRPLPNGRYIILAGHRRTEGARRAGLTMIDAFIADVDDATATIIFYATNLGSRHTLRPSEKARGYQRIEESLGARGVTNGRTSAAVAEISGDNKRQIQRYMRLNYLNSGLLKLLDSGAIPFRAGVELSYLSSLSQDNLLAVVETLGLSEISMQQGEALHALADEQGDLKKPEIKAVLRPEKQPKPKKQLYKISHDVVKGFFAESASQVEIEQTIVKALRQYFMAGANQNKE